MNYEAVIGLEIHVQLDTKAKTFCGCSTDYGALPNSHTCPVCLALPGALPVVNQEAIKKAVIAGRALNCEVADYSVFARKNYFYPDLPKAYQISQFEYPLNRKGCVFIQDDRGNGKRIGIIRAHLEEDAGKLVHDEDPNGPSYIDFNRCGVPLLEIVTEPEIRSPDEAYRFLQLIKEILQYARVSECNMEKGELRVDVNISMREEGKEGLGVKQEIKNMNSFANVRRALEYEIKRQTKILRSRNKLTQQTRLFDQRKNATVAMRIKEEAHDYRYFPDPDLVPVVLSKIFLEDIERSIPELPHDRRARFIKEYGLTEDDAIAVCSSYKLANYFEETAKNSSRPKRIANWIITELMRVLNEKSIEADQCTVTPVKLRGLFDLMDDGVISGKIAKQVFSEMVACGKSAQSIVDEKGLRQVSNRDEIITVVNEVLHENEKVVSDYRSGKMNALGFLVGQIMKKTRGTANPKIVNELLKERMEQPK